MISHCPSRCYGRFGASLILLLLSTGNFAASAATRRKPLPKPSPGADAAREITFLKSVPPRATLAQIKRLLPRGTHFSKARKIPADEPSNQIFFSGPITGYLDFELRTTFRESGDIFHDYRPSDPIERISVIMDNVKAGPPPVNKKRIAAAIRVLGHPGSQGELSEYEVWGLSDGGTYAYWDLPHGRTIYCSNKYNVDNQGPYQMLELEFPYTSL